MRAYGNKETPAPAPSAEMKKGTSRRGCMMMELRMANGSTQGESAMDWTGLERKMPASQKDEKIQEIEKASGR